MARADRIIAGIHDGPAQHSCYRDMTMRIEAGEPMIEEGWIYTTHTMWLDRKVEIAVRRIAEVVRHDTDEGVLLVTFHGTKTYIEGEGS